MPYPEGIDVSNNNGRIDWAAVASTGMAFGIAKITEGTWFRDGFFRANWDGMKANHIFRGAYHFARPSRSTAVAEADYFVNAFELLGRQLEPGDLAALDLEDPDVPMFQDLSAWTLAWLRRVEERVGFKPLCYTSPGYAQQHRLANLPPIGEYGLWLASWGVPTPPPAPAPWELVAFHQYAVDGPGSVPGVVGEIDRNRFNGPVDASTSTGCRSRSDVPLRHRRQHRATTSGRPSWRGWPSWGTRQPVTRSTSRRAAGAMPGARRSGSRATATSTCRRSGGCSSTWRADDCLRTRQASHWEVSEHAAPCSWRSPDRAGSDVVEPYAS
jgi:GH25 family lysozyme M1 (1,4-beta-N-acetylmuramidase)